MFLNSCEHNSLSMNIRQLLLISLLSYFIVQADTRGYPCDDFYDFACYAFINDAHVPEDKVFVDQLTLLDDDMINKMRKLLTDENSNDQHSDKLAKTYYNACLRKDTNVGELREILRDLHGLPVSYEWNETTYDWTQALFKLRDLGMSLGFLFELELEFSDAGFYEAFIWKTYRPNNYITNDTRQNPDTADYYRYMTDAAELLGADRRRAEPDLMDVLLFENEFQKITRYGALQGKHKYLSSVAELSEMEPRFPWLEYINKMIPGDKEVNETLAITEYPSDYIVMLMDLTEQTDKRTLANFINWKVVDFAFDYMSENLKALKPSFMEVSDLSPISRTEEEECILDTVRKFQDVAANMFLRKYFTKADQGSVAEMVEEIKEEFRQMINETAWMDEQTKEEARIRLDHLKIEIGYPEGLKENNQLEKKYEQLTLTPDSFLQINMNVSRFLQDVYFSRLNQPSVEEDVDDHIFERVTVNHAFFHTSQHKIDLPAGLLQPPIFNRNSSKEANYGSTGYVIGHEINHAFNERASYFNIFGDYMQWWTEATEDAFRNKSQCVINVYEDIVEEYLNEKVNGKRSVEENLADLTGAKLAYRANQKKIKQNQEEELTIEGHTPNQRFWLSLANFHCAKYDIPKLKQSRSLRYDTHLPRKVRMNGIAMNNEDFARDWNCDAGSQMNPKEKCSVW